jgi:hypothetical protein
MPTKKKAKKQSKKFKKTVKRPTKRAVKKTVKKAAKKAVKKTVKKAVKRTAKKTVKKNVKKKKAERKLRYEVYLVLDDSMQVPIKFKVGARVLHSPPEAKPYKAFIQGVYVGNDSAGKNMMRYRLSNCLYAQEDHLSLV